MSDDMSSKETATGEDNIKFDMDEASTASATDVAEVKPDVPDDVTIKEPEGTEEFANGAQEANEIPKEEEAVTEDRKSVKRRASVAFSDEEENEFKGFDVVQDSNGTEKYTTLLDRMEAELATALDNYKPLRNVTAVPSSGKSKHTSRPDTDGSRPSSGLSSRSDSEGLAYLTDLSSGAKGRRLTMDMSSPLLRVPLERGWKRELVYRAALDSHSRRNADIYYYSPQGKKLRSTREVSENISGTGLTLENFSFFKEPLGINDPEKEIIRDAKVLRRVESPVPTAAPPLDGKRTPKPKPPKGVSPEPAAVPSALKIKVKSLGSRLSSGAQSTPPNNKGKRTDNNNTPTWKKPKPAMAPVASGAPGAIGSAAACGVQGSAHLSPAAPSHPPPPLQSRPQQQHTSPQEQTTRQLVQPCSMSCGRGAVPSLACVACLCLYHPVCVGHSGHAHTFYCKNCRVSPSVEPPPLTHKSGITVSAVVRPRATRPSAPSTAPPAHTLRAPPPTAPPPKRVLLRMKVSGGGPDGERVWAVTKPPGAAGGASPRTLALRPSLPQSIAVLGTRRFIIVPRSLVQTFQQPQ